MAFIRAAKLCHPDVTMKTNLGEAQREFIALKLAYDVLNNPESRALYTQTLARQGPEAAAKWEQGRAREGAEGGEGASRESDGNFRWRKRRGVKDLVSYSRANWEEFERDLEEALNQAYHGPVFVPTPAIQFPEAFETEELNSLRLVGAEERVVCLQHAVCGRQVLGRVDWLRPSPLAAAAAAAAAALTTTLELRLDGDAEPIARATRDEGAATIVFERRRRQADGESGGSWVVEAVLHEAKNVLTRPRSRPRPATAAAEAEADVETHRVIRTRAPGVHSLLLYSRRGFVEFKGTRAWLPPQAMWIWEPRDSRYSVGGWYWEQNKHGLRSSKRVQGLRAAATAAAAAASAAASSSSIFDSLRTAWQSQSAAKGQDENEGAGKGKQHEGAETWLAPHERGSGDLADLSQPLDASVVVLLSGFDALVRLLKDGGEDEAG